MSTRPRWRRVNLGLYLVGIGLLLLMTSLKRLPWSFWIEVAAFWPVVLVALGIRILFERSRMPALVLLSPALVLGTLAYVVLRPPPQWRGEWVALRAERPPGLNDWTLVARLARAEVDISSRDLPADVLAEGRAGSERGLVSLRSRGRPDRYSLEARTQRSYWAGVPGRERWELQVSRDLPVLVQLRLAFGRGQVDLSDVRVRRFDVDGAFNDLVIRLGPVQEDVRLDVDGAFNSIKLVVPPSTPVNVRTKGALLFVDARDDAGSALGPGYSVTLDGFLSSLEVESAPR